MNELSLDEKIKHAELEKVQADAQKTREEIKNLARSRKNETLIETVKIIGGVVLGVGGLITGITQYQLSEARTEIANAKLLAAEEATKQTLEARDKAVSEMNEAIAAKERAQQEETELAATVSEYRKLLATEVASPQIVNSRLVYIQFRGDISRENINSLRDNLQKLGYQAPGGERIDTDYRPLVKYFSSDDQAAASQLASDVQAYFESQGCPITLSITRATAPTPTSPLELWLPHSC